MKVVLLLPMALSCAQGSSITPVGDSSISIETIESPAPAGHLVGKDGQAIMLNPPAPGYVPQVSGEAAIEEAKQHVGTTVGPTSITAQLALFGEGDPVWVVTYDGICTSVSGGPPEQSPEACPITKESAVINATTGLWTSNYW